jgi:GDP-4-dehydro-6-deoxy-D-mannose reductase
VRYFITGIGGFAATHLAATMLAEGHTVTGIARRSVAEPWAALVRRFPRFDPAQVSIGDVCDRAALERALRQARPDGVFHLAAQSAVGTGERDAGTTFAVNAVGTLQVLAACREYGSGRVLVVGSGESYGSVAGAERLAEETPLRPRSIYGASKAAAEILARQAVDAYAQDIVCVRPFNHTGPGQSPRFVCADFARQIAAVERGQAAGIRVGNLEAVRDFLDVRDVARAYLRLWEQGDRGGTYNVCSGVGRSIAKVLDALLSRARVPVLVEVDAERLRPVDVPHLVGDNQRLCTLGWRPQHAWAATLDDVLADWRGRG